MSLIGLLEQLKLSSILRRIEVHAKTGLLVVRQGDTTVELYFRDGLLMCIGPQRTNITFGERLLQDGIISSRALRETMATLRSSPHTENNIALTLLNLSFVDQASFRSWATRNALDVLNLVLSWNTGEIHFEENATPPPDRLLVALSSSTLLAAVQPAEQNLPSQPPQSSTATVMPPKVPPGSQPPSTPAPDIARIPTLLGASRFTDEHKTPGGASQPQSFLAQEPPDTNALFSARSLVDDSAFAPQAARQNEAPRHVSALSLIELDALPSSMGNTALSSNASSAALPATETFTSIFSDAGGSSPSDASPSSAFPSDVSFALPQPVTTVAPPRKIDTSYMRPDMLLMPADLSMLRDRNIWIQLTPDQWRLLTKVDGRTSLRDACQELSMRPEVLCQVAGELVVDQLIQLLPSDSGMAQELSPTSREFMASGLGNGYVAPGYSAVPAHPWNGSVPPLPDAIPPFPSSPSFETESQWGNGGNGASFIPGRGWIAAPQPPQAMSPSSASLSYAGAYTPMGGAGWR